MKTVNFLGQDWEVPDWAVFISQDESGAIWVWETEPLCFDGEWLPYDDGRREEVGDSRLVASIKKID